MPPPLRQKLFLLIIPFVLGAGMITAPAADYKSAYQQQYTKDHPIEMWLKDNEQIVTILLALSVPLGGWLLSSFIKAREKQKEAGRQQFLALATATITDSVSERLVAKLELLEERIEWIYKEISDFESKLHITDNEVNQMRLELSKLTTEVKVLRATRREFLHRLNEQLQAAEQQLSSIVNEYCAGHSCQDYKPRLSRPIEDPFDNCENDTLF